MKALRVHGPRDVRYEDVPDPVVGPDDVLVRIEAAGLCATDIEVYDGTMFYLTSGLTRLPFTLGHEWCGQVVSCGGNVRNFATGDRVAGECSVGCRSCRSCLAGRYHLCVNRTETGLLNRDGGFAELIAFPSFFLHHCYDLPPEAAALIEPTAVALNAIRSCRTEPGDHVVVIGTGPIGLLAIQAAKVFGARCVVAIDADEHRLGVARELGADAVYLASDPDIPSQVAEQTNGRMIDVAIEASGKPAGWAHIPRLMAPMGRVGLVGLFAGQTCPVNFDPFIVNNVTLHGCLGGPNLWADTIDLMRNGKIRVAPLATHRFAFSEFSKAVEVVSAKRDHAIKAILKP